MCQFIGAGHGGPIYCWLAALGPQCFRAPESAVTIRVSHYKCLPNACHDIMPDRVRLVFLAIDKKGIKIMQKDVAPRHIGFDGTLEA
jgi:hypothetical protein